MAFSVTRSNGTLVKPFEETPSCTLDLSGIDNAPMVGYEAKIFYLYRRGPDEADKVMREALSKALVPYYPLAGRFKEPGKIGQLQVNCCGEGVWFVYALANCTLDSVNYFYDNDGAYTDLFPEYAPETEGSREPFIKIQVTQFAWGGFAIGIIYNHRLCDGIGGAQFLNAIGELARGLEHPTIKPVWERGIFLPPRPQQNVIAAASLGAPPNFQLEHARFDISADQINRLKQEFRDSTGKTCSAFDVVMATVWRCRTQAINLKQNTEVRLTFLANCRQFVDPPLPEGYYGNCIFPLIVKASSETIAHASNADVVKLIQEAKAKLPVEFVKYLKGYDHIKHGEEDPLATPLVYTTMFATGWFQLGLQSMDFGWGPPLQVTPIIMSDSPPVAIFGSLPEGSKQGIRLSTRCVEKAHRQPFIDRMSKIF